MLRVVCGGGWGLGVKRAMGCLAQWVRLNGRREGLVLGYVVG